MSTPTSIRDLVIGTHNRKKGVELAELLSAWGFSVTTLADVPNAIEVVENGDSFAANARLKATEQARHLGRWVLADDSGLSVDALDGAPGIYSARYAAWGKPSEAASAELQKDPATGSADGANNRRLLAELQATFHENVAPLTMFATLQLLTRRARFAQSHEICRGRILCDASGANGFGYDPLFEVVEYHRTFGELGLAVKRAISHRSRALRAVLPQLLALSASTGI